MIYGKDKEAHLKTMVRRLVLVLLIVGAVAVVMSAGSPAFACKTLGGCDACDTPADQSGEQICILRTFICNNGSWTEEYCWG